jgi:hypothetical protein
MINLKIKRIQMKNQKEMNQNKKIKNNLYKN